MKMKVIMLFFILEPNCFVEADSEVNNDSNNNGSYSCTDGKDAIISIFE